MRKYLKATSIALTLSLIMVFSLSARPRGRRGFKRRGVRIFMRLLRDNRFLKEAGISKAKATAIRNIFRASIKRSIPIRAKIKVNRINMREAFQARDVDAQRIMEIAKRIKNLKWQLASIRLRAKIKITNMFTYEQREKLRNVIKTRFRRFGRRGRRGRRFGRRGRRGRGEHRR